jgi:uncharacterized protein (TIGR03000 family)
MAAALLFASGAVAGPHGGGGGGHAGGGHASGGHASFHGGGASFHGGMSHASFHSGNFHSGSFHSGNFHNGNFHNGFHNGNFHNGFHNGNFHNGFNHHRGFVGVGLSFGPSWGYGYGGYPYYDYGYGYSYGAAPYYDYGYATPAAYDFNYSGPPYVTPAVMPQADAQGDNQPQRQPGDTTAHIEIRVPADAEVWFGSGKTTQTGTRREFVSPPLEPGKDFTYDIRARWVENGKEVVRTRTLDVSAGAWKGVDFTKPPAEGVEPPKPGKP